jgi:two-component system nitrogen regulation response regulator GlnG
MTDHPEVWLLDDDTSIRWVLEQAFSEAGMEVKSFEAAQPFLAAFETATPDVVITDVRMPDADGIHLMKQLGERFPLLPVIIITAHSDLESAVSAYEGGAFEYLPKPFDVDQAVALVRRAAQASGSRAPPAAESDGFPSLIGRAPGMQEVFRAIGRLSRSSMTVMITGESGTGKELVATALHRHSPRQRGPFIALNTSAIPSELLESELFGHERGAFTGADSAREGRFEQAHGGTIFLDEIGDMSPALQTRLLRVLAEGEFYRVGGKTPIRVDARVIAATHQDLETRVAEGTFREDLYHRLNVIRIRVPALRERPEDVSVLLDHYLEAAAVEAGVAPKSLSDAAREALQRYDWPGNVRELVNVCRRLTLLAPGDQVGRDDLLPELGPISGAAAGGADSWTVSLSRWAESTLAADGPPLLDSAMPEFERVLIRAALARAGGHRQHAARLLGWGRNTLTRKMRSLGMD